MEAAPISIFPANAGILGLKRDPSFRWGDGNLRVSAPPREPLLRHSPRDRAQYTGLRQAYEKKIRPAAVSALTRASKRRSSYPGHARAHWMGPGSPLVGK